MEMVEVLLLEKDCNFSKNAIKEKIFEKFLR